MSDKQEECSSAGGEKPNRGVFTFVEIMLLLAIYFFFLFL